MKMRAQNFRVAHNVFEVPFGRPSGEKSQERS